MDVRHGRESFAQHAWAEAFDRLRAADQEAPLEPIDMERLADAAYLLGRDAESEAARVRAHHDFLRRDEPERAVRSIFWLASGLLNRGERARAAGWLARARRLLDRCTAGSAEHGYLLLLELHEPLARGDLDAALAACHDALAIGERCADPDLVTLARHSRGRVLIRMRRIHEGVAMLDEAMAAVDAGAVAPLVAGEVYCSVIAGCLEVFDYRRAHEWTAAFAHWCDAEPDLVAYRGECMVRRAEILQLHGSWDAAADAAREAVTEPVDGAAAGAAYYRQGELCRLRGDFAGAEEAYRQASRCGRNVQPGLALLRLAQQQTDAAAGAIRRALEEGTDQRTRARLLPACAEIMLAAGDIRAAEAAADELAGIAAELDAPLLHAAAAQAAGAVMLARGEAAIALPNLRRAWTTWLDIGAPYEAARVRVLIARACSALGDDDSAAMQLDAARWSFRQLGAAPELQRIDRTSRHADGTRPSPLTARELEVLREVAAGKTNRAIAADLFISERTVDRHVSNILSKLGLPSRAAATAYAYEHDLLA